MPKESSYHQFHDEVGNPYGSFEVFYDDDDQGRNFDSKGSPVKSGWYWWPCFPGCLPDTTDDPHGPFASKEDAIDDADYKIMPNLTIQTDPMTRKYLIRNGEFVFRYRYDRHADVQEAIVFLEQSKDDLTNLFLKPSKIVGWENVTSDKQRGFTKGEKTMAFGHVQYAEGSPSTPNMNVQTAQPKPSTRITGRRGYLGAGRRGNVR